MAGYETLGVRMRRAWDVLRGRSRSESPPPLEEVTEPVRERRYEEYEPPNATEVLAVASRGDVFDLHLIPYFRWSSEDMDLDVLVERSSRYVEPARGRLLREAWQTARTHGPNDAAQAEQAINDLYAVREGWCYDDERGMIRCRPTVRVMLDPRLRDHILPFELDRIQLDAHHREAMVNADYIEERALRWLDVIKQVESIEELGAVERQFLAPFAAMMTDTEFAKTMAKLANLRTGRTSELLTVLRQAGKSHESVGLFEFAKAYDRAVTAFSKQMGLDPYQWLQDDMAVGGAE